MTIGGQPGPWPVDFPFDPHTGRVSEGLAVRSLAGSIEGRTTGGRLPCSSHDCPGWFIAVTWETGQRMRICSEGWAYDKATRQVQVTGGGEISARFVSPKPLGTPPLPENEWPSSEDLNRGAGWRVNPKKD